MSFSPFTHVLAVILASSYVTLGISAPGQAEQFWAPYGGVMFLLAVLNLWGEGRAR